MEYKQEHLPRRGTQMTRINRNLSLRGIGHALHALLLNITRIFTDPCASASSVFYCTPSAFICVHLRLNKLIFRQMKKEKRDLIMTIEEEGIEIYTNPS